MIYSKKFLAGVEYYEGFYPRRYRDPVGKWTIGIGHLIVPGDPYNASTMQFGGSVTDGTQEAWDAVVWEDERPKPTWDALCAAHFVRQNKTEILENIRLLETQQTDRRIREATLTEEGKFWLQNLNSQIEALRKQLP